VKTKSWKAYWSYPVGVTPAWQGRLTGTEYSLAYNKEADVIEVSIEVQDEKGTLVQHMDWIPLESLKAILAEGGVHDI
jgi:hypothetical protein